jgi:hypothetical protein
MSTLGSVKSVPVLIGGSVPNGEVGHIGSNHISRCSIEGMAIGKYKSCGLGITFEDIQERFRIKKRRAQRSLKYFHAKKVLFTAEDLISQDIDYLRNTSPQQYFPAIIKADIIENLKRRKSSVLVGPTGVCLPKSANQFSSRSSKRCVSRSLENQKAQSFLDVLLHIPFVPLYIHKLQLMTHIDKEYYNELSQKEGRINRAKRHEEIIGRRHVNYTFSPNGSIEISVRSSDTPFKLEIDTDESAIFSFLGQVKDRLLYCINDIKERLILPIQEWVLQACDLNRDIRIDDKCQLTLPDIQLKTAARVFRLYIKSLQDRAVCRAEESVKLNFLLPEALDNIRHPYKSIESKLQDISQQIDDVLLGKNKKHSQNNSTAQSATSNDTVGGYD